MEVGKAIAPENPVFNLTERRNWQRRFSRLTQMLKFGMARGASVKQMARLFYYGGLKAPLVYRGWAANSPDRLLRFSIRAAKGITFEVWPVIMDWISRHWPSSFLLVASSSLPSCRRFTQM